MTAKQFVFSNMGLKLTAFLLALTVWVIIAGQEHAHLEKNFEVNVEFYNTSENIDANPRPGQVRINIKGSSREIKNISPEDFKIKIDLAGISQNTTLNLLSADFLELPDKINPEEVTVHPRMISVTIKELTWKEVAVKVHYKGKVKQGITLTRKIVPEKVRIYGYKSRINAISAVYAVETIDLGEIVESKTVKLPLQKREEILRFEGIEVIELELIVEDNTEDEKAKEK
jgi:YbbR domain-containing protein